MVGDIQRLRRENQDFAIKQCEVDQVSEKAINRLAYLHSNNEQFEKLNVVWRYEFTYCFKEGDPRRLWCAHSEETFYLLWWDKDHEVSDDQSVAWGVNKKACSETCFHPNKVNYEIFKR